MSYTNFKYHIIFSTKNRRPLLRNPLKERLVKYIGGIMRNLRGMLLEANGPEDHLHLVAAIPPTRAVADFVRDVKSNSSAWARAEFPELNFSWQSEYAGFCVVDSIFDKVVAYVRGQEQHHKKMTFDEELRILLVKNGIEFDENHMLL